jgi:hypothetical protein
MMLQNNQLSGTPCQNWRFDVLNVLGEGLIKQETRQQNRPLASLMILVVALGKKSSSSTAQISDSKKPLSM